MLVELIENFYFYETARRALGIILLKENLLTSYQNNRPNKFLGIAYISEFMFHQRHIVQSICRK